MERYRMLDDYRKPASGVVNSEGFVIRRSC